MDVIIKIENVNLWYEKGTPVEVHTLKNINLEIERGDYVAFFGPSGCGKTTMLYSISGIDRFQEGKVLINGRDISGLTNQELAIFRQTGIGIVFQQFNLVPSLTVLKNVGLPMLFVGISSEKADIEAMKLLERLNLKDFADRYPHELSGGQQQRVGIARALANNPPIIIADEPLGNLDSVNAKLTLEFLKELNEKDGRTIIMVTHEAWSLRDVKTIYHMKDGEITNIEKVKKVEEVEPVATAPVQEISQAEQLEVEADHKSVRILANFLLRGYSIEEIVRFEQFTNEFFSQKIDKEQLYKMIDLPYKDGGVGLYKNKAIRVTNYLAEVLEKRKELKSMYDLIDNNPELPISEEVTMIRNWLLQDHDKKLSYFQIKAFDQVISDRIRHFLPQDKVVEMLNLPIKKFGAGFTFRAAQTMSEKLELVLHNSALQSSIQETNTNFEKKL